MLLADRIDGDLDLTGPEITDRGDLLDVDLLLGEPLDVLEQSPLTGLGERDRHTFAAGPSHSTDAVDIAFRRRGHVVVDDMGEGVDIETASSDVGGDEARRCRP